jgi:AraC-like DNA-binding protein
LLHLLELVERWSVKPHKLLQGTGVNIQQLAEPGRRLELPRCIQLIERARELTSEPGLGFYLGLHMRIAAHGHLGFAAMTARTLGDAIALADRFGPIRTTALHLRLLREDGKAFLMIDELADLGSARDVVVLALVVGLWKIGSAITGRELVGSAHVAYGEPSYFKRFAPMLPGPVKFEQHDNRLVFDASLLDLPLGTADAAALKLARTQCERELEALGFDGDTRLRARAVLVDASGQFRGLTDVARSLHLSERTMKRRLAEAGTSFSELVDDERKHRAMALLTGSKLSVEVVADRLGYSDTGNFTRAFRRWTGTTPRRFRQDHE